MNNWDQAWRHLVRGAQRAPAASLTPLRSGWAAGLAARCLRQPDEEGDWDLLLRLGRPALVGALLAMTALLALNYVEFSDTWSLLSDTAPLLEIFTSL